MTITEFLLARIAEDEEVAFGGAPSPWRDGAWDGEHNGPREVLDRHGDVTACVYYGGTYGHVLRFNPTRVLADCEAKRRAIDAAWSDHVRIEGEWGMSQSREAMDAKDDVPEVVAVLASVYASHPDYDATWGT